MTLDWATGILLAALGQNLVVAAVVLGMRTGRPADLRLVALLIVLAGKTTPYIYGWRGHVEPPDWLALFPLNMPLALGPLLYIYVYARSLGRPPRREWLHLGPALIQLVYCCACLLLPAPLGHGWKETGHDHWAEPVLEFAFASSLVAYTLLTAGLLRRVRGMVEVERSDADRYSTSFVGASVAVLGLTAVAYAGIFVYARWFGELDIGPFFLWLALLSFGMSLDGWRYTAIPSLAVTVETPDESGRRDRDWAAAGAEWRDRIEKAGWWREPQLTLGDVSRRLGVNTTYLSRAFNEGLGSSFNRLVNDLRASEVGRRINAGASGELLAMAFDAGFSSKATFNRAFQARFGVSPSAYRAAAPQGIAAPLSSSATKPGI